MLETKFKIALLVAVLCLSAMPIAGILRGTTRPPLDESAPEADSTVQLTTSAAPRQDDMVVISAGPFVRGTRAGGYDEAPERTVYLDAYAIDRYEVTNHQYQAFILATAHRKAAPPSRYAKNLTTIRGINQPAVYVSWDDADAYCRWKGKRLATEAEWEKAMRGVDGRLWPWGSDPDVAAANWASAKDGFDFTAPGGSFAKDVSPFGVADGAGNVMEWVADWYAEDTYRDPNGRNPRGPDHGLYKVLRGGGYTSTGKDVRITSRSRMVPDFRDETIGFRCAVSEGEMGTEQSLAKNEKITKNQSSTE
jgi:sulfatase modifying factor 1